MATGVITLGRRLEQRQCLSGDCAGLSRRRRVMALSGLGFDPTLIDRTGGGGGGGTVSPTPSPSTPAAGAVKVQIGDSGKALTFIPAAPGSTRHKYALAPYHAMMEGYSGPFDAVTIPINSSLFMSQEVPGGARMATDALREIVRYVKKNSECRATTACASRKIRTPGGVQVDNIFLGTGKPCLRVPKTRFVANFGTQGGPCAGSERPAVDLRLMLAAGRGVPVFKTRLDEVAAGLGDNPDRAWVVEAKLVNRRTRQTGISWGGEGPSFSNGNVVDLHQDDLALVLIFRRRPKGFWKKIWGGIKSVGNEILEAVGDVADELGDMFCDLAKPLASRFNNLSRQAEEKIVASKIREYASQGLSGKVAEAKTKLVSDPVVVEAAAKAEVSPERLAELGVQLSPGELARQLQLAFVHKLCPNEPAPEFPPSAGDRKGLSFGFKLALGAGALVGGGLLVRTLTK